MSAEDYFDPYDLEGDHDNDEGQELAFDKVIAKTEKAFLFVKGDKEFWVPRSVCNVYEDEKVVWVPSWFEPVLRDREPTFEELMGRK